MAIFRHMCAADNFGPVWRGFGLQRDVLIEKSAVLLLFFCGLIISPPVSAWAAIPGVEQPNAADAEAERKQLHDMLTSVREDMKKIMKSVAEGTKEEQEELKKEVEKLKEVTAKLQQEITSNLKKNKDSMRGEAQALLNQLKDYQFEADKLKADIDKAAAASKRDMARENDDRKKSLNLAKLAAAQTKAEMGEALRQTRELARNSRQEVKVAMIDSKTQNLGAVERFKRQNKEEQRIFTLDAKRGNKESLQALNLEKERGRGTRAALKEVAGATKSEEGYQKRRLGTASERARAESADATSRAGRYAGQKAKKKVVEEGAETVAKRQDDAHIRALARRRAAAEGGDAAGKAAGVAKGKKTAEEAQGVVALEKKRKQAAEEEAAKKKKRRADELVIGKRVPEGVTDLSGEKKKRRLGTEQGLLHDKGKVEEEVLPEDRLLVGKDLEDQEDMDIPDPLLPYKFKLAEWSNRIKSLKLELAEGKKGARPLLMSLGDTYFESMRYMRALPVSTRRALMNYADLVRLIIGSQEMAVWAFQSAIRLDAADGEANLRLARVFDETGESGDAYYYAKMAYNLFVEYNQMGKAEEAEAMLDDLSKKLAGSREKSRLVSLSR